MSTIEFILTVLFGLLLVVAGVSLTYFGINLAIYAWRDWA